MIELISDQHSLFVNVIVNNDTVRQTALTTRTGYDYDAGTGGKSV